MRNVICPVVVAVLLTIGLASPARTADSLESLLKECKIEYTRTPEGVFKILIEVDKETTLVIARETSVGKDSKDPDLKLVYLFTSVVEVPKNFKHPAAMLKKIAEVNDTLLIGKISLSEEGHVWYNSSFWLRVADCKVLTNELVLAHLNRKDFHKELAPFVAE